MNRPITTLFLLASLDGKISTGATDALDIDQDFPRIVGVREGLQQYYELEQQTDPVSFNSGKVQAKVGANQRTWDRERDDVSFVVVDNKPHLDINGTRYFAKRSDHLYLITTNKHHPGFALQPQYGTMHILLYENQIDFVDVFRRLYKDFHIERVTIQTGGTLNAELLQLGLIDHVSIVIAPCLIGGQATPSLVGGESFNRVEDIQKISALKLTQCTILQHSYLHVQYDVVHAPDRVSLAPCLNSV